MNTAEETKTIAATIRRNLRAARKRGDLPIGTTFSSRSAGGSQSFAVHVRVSSPQPGQYEEQQEAIGGWLSLTSTGRAIVRTIANIIAPYQTWAEDDMHFVHCTFDGVAVPFDPTEVREPTANTERRTTVRTRTKPTLRRAGTGAWVIDPQGQNRTTGINVTTYGTHEEALRSLTNTPRPRFTVLNGGRTG